MWGPQGLQVSGEDHRAVNAEQAMPLSFPSKISKGEEASTPLRKKFPVKKTLLLLNEGTYHFLHLSLTSQPVLPETLRPSHPSPRLTSEVSEGGERVPNSGLVKFSQNLGLQGKYIWKSYFLSCRTS